MSQTVSVVIPTFNYGQFIAEAIQSVVDQTHSANEIIVVDDGSTDNTSGVVKSFGEPVKYVRQDNAGVCAARNRGVEESTSNYIAFLDADDFWELTNLEKQLSRLATDEGIGLIHCGIREFDSGTGETIRMMLDGGEASVADNLLLWEGNVIIGPGAITVSREAFDAVGGFDTRMKVGEDWDFCYRVARKFKVGFVPEPLVNYRSHTAAAHRNVDEMERGMGRFLEKAFDTDDPNTLALKRRAYGNYHRVMAGSYLHSGQYVKCFQHSVKSIVERPANLSYFLKFPLRRLK